MKYVTTAVALAMFAAGLAAAAEDSEAAQKGGDAPVALLLGSSAFAADDALAGGCWARLYKTRNYAGTVLTLTGPVAIASLGSAALGKDEFGRTYESVVMGPNAKLTVWAEQNYDDNRVIFEPGQKVPALRDVKSYFDEIKSMKLDCPA